MKIHTLSDFCESMGLPITMVPEVCAAFERRFLLNAARQEARLSRCAGRPDAEARPLCDEAGNEFGRVEARIPRDLFFNLAGQKSFGWEGLQSDEGMADILRDFPQCRVKTISGRITSGWTPGRRVVKKYAL